MSSITKGQKLWYVPRGRGCEPYEVTVTKVGRKWATIGEGYKQERIDINSLYADGGGYTPPGKCYLSREEYETKIELTKLWDKLQQGLRYCSCPAGVTVSDIKQVMQLLKMEE